MLFMTSWTISPENRDRAVARFRETGGQPPEGVKIIGRWHGLGQGKGVAIAEAGDPEAMARWAYEWSDVMQIEVIPVMDDQSANRVFFE